jgi:hypothetical protein
MMMIDQSATIKIQDLDLDLLFARAKKKPIKSKSSVLLVTKKG